MTTKAILAAAFCVSGLATAAAAQTEADTMTDEEIEAADVAADEMYVGVYGTAAPARMTVRDAISRLEELGYTNIHDLDVEWGRYEVEAYAPNGNEVEIEFDPVTGAVLDVEDNWF